MFFGLVILVADLKHRRVETRSPEVGSGEVWVRVLKDNNWDLYGFGDVFWVMFFNG